MKNKKFRNWNTDCHYDWFLVTVVIIVYYYFSVQPHFYSVHTHTCVCMYISERDEEGIKVTFRVVHQKPAATNISLSWFFRCLNFFLGDFFFYKLQKLKGLKMIL